MQATSQLAEDMFLQSEAVDCNIAAFTAAHRYMADCNRYISREGVSRADLHRTAAGYRMGDLTTASQEDGRSHQHLPYHRRYAKGAAEQVETLLLLWKMAWPAKANKQWGEQAGHAPCWQAWHGHHVAHQGNYEASPSTHLHMQLQLR